MPHDTKGPARGRVARFLIDHVAVGDRPEGHIRKALLRVLRPVFGRERSSVWEAPLSMTS
jgi:hypothetical protein